MFVECRLKQSILCYSLGNISCTISCRMNQCNATPAAKNNDAIGWASYNLALICNLNSTSFLIKHGFGGHQRRSTPPTGSKCIHFHVVFGRNGQIVGWRPLRDWRPLWEILDPPLMLLVVTITKHTNVHKNKWWSCKVENCPYTCNDPRNLRAHMFSHSEKLRYSCLVCSKAFKYYEQLKRHRTEHM